jgi:hypothetical protein
MARPSKLSEEQWERIRQRVLAGESVNGLAKEYGISEGAIRQKVKKQRAGRISTTEIKEAVARSVQNDLNDPVVRDVLERAGQHDRDLFQSHKADLLETILQLNITVKIAAQNAAKLARMSKVHFDKLEDDSPLNAENRVIKADAMELQVDSNEAIKAPMKFFEIATKQPPPPPEDKPVRIIGGLPDVPYE